MRVKDWAEALALLKKTNGAGTRVAVVPDATLQYFPNPEADPGVFIRTTIERRWWMSSHRTNWIDVEGIEDLFAHFILTNKEDAMKKNTIKKGLGIYLSMLVIISIPFVWNTSFGQTKNWPRTVTIGTDL